MSTTQTPPEEQQPLIDTSKMSTGQRAAMELTEAARESEHARTFAGGHVHGRIQPVHGASFPIQRVEDRDQGDAFLKQLEALLHDKVDADEIDRTGEIPQPVIDDSPGSARSGSKCRRNTAGSVLSQTNYCRAAMLLGSWCGNLTALISAHQSIGVPQPLILFGTEPQKRKYLPRARARGNLGIRAHGSGRRLRPGRDGHARRAGTGRKAFPLEWRKTLVQPNGTKAGVIVVMAKTPPKIVNGKTEGADHRVHRRDGLAGRRGAAPLPFHGLEGALQRRHPFHQRPCAGGKYSARRR